MARRPLREEPPARRRGGGSGSSHAATLMVTLGLAAAFAALNLYPVKMSTTDGVTTVEYGRPWVGWRRTYSEATPEKVTMETQTSGRNLDVGIAVGVIVAAALFTELKMRPSAPRARPRGRLRDDEDSEEDET